MAIQEIKGFLGVNLRRDRLSLLDQELARAINADLASVVGTLRVRRGRRKQYATALSDLAIRQIAKVSSTPAFAAARRYRVAGQSLYRDETRVANGVLSSLLRTMIVPYRPLNDSATWAFVADAATMRKDDGTNLRTWGIAAPTVTPVVVKGYKPLLRGTYSFRMTYLRFDGNAVAHESNPSPVSESIFIGSALGRDICIVDIADPEDAQVNGLAFYRTVSDGSEHLMEKRLKFSEMNKWAVTHGFEASAGGGNQLSLQHSFNLDPALVPQNFSNTTQNAAVTSFTKNGTSYVNNAAVGTQAWSPTASPDPLEALSYLSTSGAVVTNYLEVTNFGFNLPSTAIIRGVEVTVSRRRINGSEITDSRIEITRNGAVAGDNKATADPWPTATASETYGSPTDLWGRVWNQINLVNASNFGVVISCQMTGTGSSMWANVKSVTMKIYTDSVTVVSTVELEKYRGTQSWEPIGAGQSEDSRGYHATYDWEIEDYAITQTKRYAWPATVTDSFLGVAVERDNDLPPNAGYAATYQEHVFLAGDPSNPHYLYWPKRFRPEAYPLANFLEIGNPSDPITGLVVNGGLLSVFTRGTKYRILGNDTSGFLAIEALSKRGTRSPWSVHSSEFGIPFVAPDGVYLTTLVAEDKELSGEIERLFLGDIVNDYLPINLDAADRISAATFKRKLYVAYPSGDSPDPDTLMVYATETGKWYFWDASYGALYVEEDASVFVGGGLDGFCYQLEDGSTDDGSAIALSAQTKDFAGDATHRRKLFRYFRVDADTQGDTITVRFLVDGTVKATATVNGVRTKNLFRVGDGAMGYSWRVEFDYSGKKQVEIYGVSAEYEELKSS